MKKKRCRKSRTMQTQQQESVEEEDGTEASIKDLPIQILLDILSRLSVKSIFRCRSVSKLWLSILLTPDFAKLHFSRAPICPLLRNPNGKCISTALYLVEIERDRLCHVCDDDNRRSTKMCAKSCFYHGTDGHVNMKLSTRFMLPNLESSPEDKFKERSFDVVNSCKGLLCLRKPSCDDHVEDLTKNKIDPVVIYNPVTGDYSVFPSPEDDKFTYEVIVGGLGCCPKTNQYKLLIVLCKRTPKPGTRDDTKSREALIYTLGSGPWRRIGNAPRILCGTSVPTFLNGALHWFVGDCRANNVIVTFDFEEEKFRIILPPHHFCRYHGWIKLDNEMQYIDKHCKGYSPPSNLRITMGVLRGRLSLCDAYSYVPVYIWEMKDYGVQESWFEKYLLENHSEQRWPAGLYQPIDFLNNGDLLMYQANNALISYDGYDFRYFKIRGFRSRFEAIPHVPSFVSLKEVMGDNIAVLNVRSRLASSELREGKTKTKPLLLVEDFRLLMSDSDSG